MERVRCASERVHRLVGVLALEPDLDLDPLRPQAERDGHGGDRRQQRHERRPPRPRTAVGEQVRRPREPRRMTDRPEPAREDREERGQSQPPCAARSPPGLEGEQREQDAQPAHKVWPAEYHVAGDFKTDVIPAKAIATSPTVGRRVSRPDQHADGQHDHRQHGERREPEHGGQVRDRARRRDEAPGEQPPGRDDVGVVGDEQVIDGPAPTSARHRCRRSRPPGRDSNGESRRTATPARPGSPARAGRRRRGPPGRLRCGLDRRDRHAAWSWRVERRSRPMDRAWQGRCVGFTDRLCASAQHRRIGPRPWSTRRPSRRGAWPPARPRARARSERVMVVRVRPLGPTCG